MDDLANEIPSKDLTFWCANVQNFCYSEYVQEFFVYSMSLFSFRSKKPTIQQVRTKIDQCSKRNIEFHSINKIGVEGSSGFRYRVAFSVTDPPGPYSLQFLEVSKDYENVLKDLKPEMKAVYYESRDEARMRVIETEQGDLLPEI